MSQEYVLNTPHIFPFCPCVEADKLAKQGSMCPQQNNSATLQNRSSDKTRKKTERMNGQEMTQKGPFLPI